MARRDITGGRRLRALTAAAVVAVWVSGCATAEEPAAVPDEDGVFPQGMVRSPVTERFVRCMRDAGWDTRPSWSGGTESVEMSPDQVSAYQAAEAACSESSGWTAANDFASWSREQIEELYRQEVQAHECFIDIGFASEEPPSLQEYVDRFYSANQYYAMLPGMESVSDVAAVVRQCPPPTWFITVDGF